MIDVNKSEISAKKLVIFYSQYIKGAYFSTTFCILLYYVYIFVFIKSLIFLRLIIIITLEWSAWRNMEKEQHICIHDDH